MPQFVVIFYYLTLPLSARVYKTMEQPAKTPEPPYYAVIFTSIRTEADADYEETAVWMTQLAAQQPGFLGVESVREGALGITVSYWQDEASIQAWKAQAEHLAAQQAGRNKWYQQYSVRVAKVERAYSFTVA